MAAPPKTDVTGAEDIHWDLGHLYEGDARARVDVDLKRGEEMALAFAERYRGRVKELAASAMAAALRELEDIEELLEKAAAFSFLSFCTDVSDPPRGALLQKVQEVGTQVGTHLLFFNLEWLAVGDEAADALLDDPAVANYRHHLKSARRYRPFVLSEPEERVMAEKSVTARAAWDRLFEEAATAIKIKLNGADASLDQALSRLHSADPAERRAVAEAITGALREDIRTRRYILNTVLVDKSIDDRLRGYPNWLAERNLANEASDESVQALVEAVASRYDIPRRYYALKKKLLGLDSFYDWDRYAPYGGDDPAFRWDEARDVVLDAYGSFSPRLQELAEEFFESRWIDAALAGHKRGGAFAHPVSPNHHPYVLLNFTGRRRDVLTLAHELGHGVHMSLSRAQTPLNFGTPLTTAETASVFGETVTFSRLLEGEKDPASRLSLMVGRIDDAVATIFRQIAMNRFEERIHTERRETGELSQDDLSRAWLDTQRDMLGDAVQCSDDYGIWWSYIPHFIGTPGYVYAYAFGNLLALAIYQRAQEEGASFAPRYFDLLAAGGSDSPEALTSRIGVHLNDPQFWHGGLNTIAALVDEAEALSQNL